MAVKVASLTARIPGQDVPGLLCRMGNPLLSRQRFSIVPRGTKRTLLLDRRCIYNRDPGEESESHTHVDTFACAWAHRDEKYFQQPDCLSQGVYIRSAKPLGGSDYGSTQVCDLWK